MPPTPTTTNIATIEEKTETITIEEDFPYVRHEAFIAGWGIATPFPVTTERFLEIDKQQRTALGQPQKTIDLMASLIKASKINHRHSCHPFFLPKDKSPADYPDAVGTASEDMFKDNINPPHHKRLSFFQETALKLCVSAAERAIEKWGQDKMLISHILSTCTSGFIEPGIPCAIIKELGLSQDIQKAELNYNGCFCGATCLRLARDLIRAGDATAVLVVACETATTHVDWNSLTLEGLVAISLFADGAAAMIIAREGVWKYKTTGSSIVPESSHLLGLRPPHAENETTYMMTLSKNVAPALRDYFSSGHGVKILKKLYNPDEPRPALAVHPGGPRILEAVGEVLIKQGWKEDALQASYDTFGYYGNLGSAAMVVVLAHRLTKNDIEEDKLVTMAFGPGVTVEYAQLERATQDNSHAAEVARVKKKFGIPVTTA